MIQYVKRLFLLTLMLLGMSVAVGQSVTVWTVDNLPMVHLQDARRYVCDPDGLLSVAARDSADRMLARLEQTKGIESVVVIVKRLEGGDCYEFGMQLARKYGVGSKKQNSGLIVVVSTEDRGYYILTGRGLEGALPDAICRRIQNRYMVPALKAGNWDEAVVASVLAITRYVQGDHSLSPEQRTEDDDTFSMWAGLFVAMAIVALMIVIARRDRRSRRCPQCHKGQMVVTHRQRFRAPDGHMMMRVTRQCSRCGYTELMDEDDEDDDHHTGMLAGFPFLFMGGGHGHGGGGGFGGGSFGGGSFGGGGSGGRF